MTAESARVLVVDDVVQNRMALERMLAQTGFAMAGEASLGQEAVAQARAVVSDAVLVAVEEPVARALRTIEMLSLIAPGVPVVAVSSLGDRDHLRRAMLAGVRDYLVKPISAEDLEKSLLALVQLQHKRSSLTGDATTGRSGEIIAVLGAKGGIGRTMIATNLAMALAIVGKHKVALVDLDTQLGDVALQLDVMPEKSLVDVVPMVDRLDPELMEGFLMVHSTGLKVLPAPSKPEDGELVTSTSVRRTVEVLSRSYDFVILDTPRVFHENTVAALDACTLAILVTTPELACVKSTRVCLSTLRSWRYPMEKVKLLVNHISRASDMWKTELEGALDHPIYWRVPHDAGTLAACSRAGRGCVDARPGASISQNLISLSYSVAGTTRPAKGLMARIRRK